MWGDVALEQHRQSRYDVAFVMPPDGGHSDQAVALFEAVKNAFGVSLKGVDRVKVVPEGITKADFARYAYTKEDELLAYDRKYGHPRIYIRSMYEIRNVDDRTRSLTFLVTPYRRDAEGKSMLQLYRWKHEPWRRTASPNEIALAALQATFSLVSFLSSENLIHLTPDEQRRFWVNLLSEYRQRITIVNEKCAEAPERLLAWSASLDETVVEGVLTERCAEAPPDEAIARAQDRAYATVGAVYAATAR